jgi:PAS domain S-box-containing protein
VLHLVLLEDNPLDAELIEAHLRSSGLSLDLKRVDSRADFTAALEAVCPDLILADYSLPSFDGLAALEVARATCPGVPFLLVSGALGEERAVELLKAGATDFILKHRLERLVPSVRRALREAQERAERRRAEKALAESEEHFRLLSACVQEYAIFLLDPAARVVSWNEGAARILGYQADEALGLPFAHFFPPEAPDQPARVLDEAREAGQAREDSWQVRKDGSRFWASGVTSALRDESGSLRGFATILRDLTDRKRLEEALRTRADQLAEAARRKDEFLAILSHELRNPLTPLRNALEIMRLCALEDPALVEARDVMERQVRQLTRLVDDLLDVFRISHRKMLLRKDRLDLMRLVELAAVDHRGALEAAGLALELDLPGQPVWVMGDSTRLAQVVGNLLHNAVKFTDRGGRVTVRVVPDDGHGRAAVQVCDTGVGIPPEVLPKLFDTFAQAPHNRHRSRGGLGLGLALVKGLVELQGGEVAASSAGEGRGAEFTLWLPLASDTRPAQGALPCSGADGARLRILIVEDNPDAARTLQVLLTRYGHEVTATHTGPEGVEAARRGRPDVVLCDLDLPGLSGFDVARTLRADPTTAAARLLAVSGLGQEDDRRHAYQAGFDLHLTKPVDPSELQQVLTAVRSHSRSG